MNIMDVSKINLLFAGFSCIDIIKIDNDEISLLGGTAANVASILSMIGLNTNFLQPRYIGYNHHWFENEFKKRKINLIEFKTKDITVPCIIEQLRQESHVFSTTCPICNKKINEIILPQKNNVKDLYEKIIPNLFFYDRISSGIKMIVQKNKTGWNMYEPNSIRIYETFLKNASDADIVKISEESISLKHIEQLKRDLDFSKVMLFIVTSGSNGFRYSFRLGNKLSDWIYTPADIALNFVDSSGAGDWFSAVFLYKFIQKYPIHVDVIDKKVLDSCFKMAAKAASYSCSFVGAQGIFEDKDGIFNMNCILDSKMHVLTNTKITKKGCYFCYK